MCRAHEAVSRSIGLHSIVNGKRGKTGRERKRKGGNKGEGRKEGGRYRRIDK